MATVLLDMAMSLDGFACGPNGEDHGLNDWFFAPSTGDKDVNRFVVQESIDTAGALIMGKTTYSMAADFGGVADTPYRVPHFIVTHHPPAAPVETSPPFLFVTDGIDSVLRQAAAAAGERKVVIGGGVSTAQQFLQAGLVDEIQIHLIPILIGAGKRLLDNVGSAPLRLEQTRVLEAVGATHLYYRVIR
ncbi:MAG: dihydrofolate reductase family protein [bacterium]|nr:dihydrofolate reductase family protein [bacterium]